MFNLFNFNILNKKNPEKIQGCKELVFYNVRKSTKKGIASNEAMPFKSLDFIDGQTFLKVRLMLI